MSISGIILGSFFAYYNYSFDNIIFILSIITAISFQILSNFANDYGDGILGTDNDRIGPKRVIATGKLTLQELKKGIIVNVFISITFSYSLIKYSFKNDYLFIVIFLFLSIFSFLPHLYDHDACGRSKTTHRFWRDSWGLAVWMHAMNIVINLPTSTAAFFCRKNHVKILLKWEKLKANR